jgi:hypothetical protein
MTVTGNQKTYWREVTPESKYLSSADLITPILIEIVSIRKQMCEFEAGRKEEKPLMTYKVLGGHTASTKPMVVNMTNMRFLQALFGDYIDDWIGKLVVLYRVDGIRSPQGGTTSGIRMREKQN